jgi:hypothetical protein
MALSRWFYWLQIIAQRLTLGCLLSLSVVAVLWSVAAAAGFAPWLQFAVGLGGTTAVDAGMGIQLALTFLLLGLCFFVPMNDRVLRLENSHREFRVKIFQFLSKFTSLYSYNILLGYA